MNEQTKDQYLKIRMLNELVAMRILITDLVGSKIPLTPIKETLENELTKIHKELDTLKWE